MMKKKVLMLIICFCITAGVAQAQILASYEPGETVVPGGLNSNDVVVTPVLASGVGLTATDGDYILQMDISAADGKIEIDHTWGTGSYDLAGYSELLFDVYVSSSDLLPGLVGIWDAAWFPPDSWQAASNLPVVGQWTTVSFDVSLREQTGLTQIWALVFEAMPSPTEGTIYMDNLRVVPEPATLCLLGIGGLLLRRRK